MLWLRVSWMSHVLESRGIPNVFFFPVEASYRTNYYIKCLGADFSDFSDFRRLYTRPSSYRFRATVREGRQGAVRSRDVLCEGGDGERGRPSLRLIDDAQGERGPLDILQGPARGEVQGREAHRLRLCDNQPCPDTGRHRQRDVRPEGRRRPSAPPRI